jgi:replicative DNA helicase
MKKLIAILLAACMLLCFAGSQPTETENPGENNAANIAEIIIAKNRHGSTGTVKMGWIGQFTKFRTIADDFSE